MYHFNFFIIHAKYNNIYRVKIQFTYLQVYIHSFPSSSKQEFYNEASIFWRQHHGAHQREHFEFWALWKPENWTLQDLSLSQVMPRKLNVALPRCSFSQMIFKIGVLKDFANFTGKQFCWSLFLVKIQASSLQLY